MSSYASILVIADSLVAVKVNNKICSRHHIAEIVLKLMLNTNQPINQDWVKQEGIQCCYPIITQHGKVMSNTGCHKACLCSFAKTKVDIMRYVFKLNFSIAINHLHKQYNTD